MAEDLDGEPPEIGAGDVTLTGLSRDRGPALVHSRTGRVVSAKNPRLWRDLLTLSAVATDSGVRITGTDGKAIWSTDADIDDVLSQRLGQPVTLTDTPPSDATLERAEPEEMLRGGVGAHVPLAVSRLGGGSPEGTFFDFAPVHLLTTSTLDRIAALSPRGTVEVASDWVTACERAVTSWRQERCATSPSRFYLPIVRRIQDSAAH